MTMHCLLAQNDGVVTVERLDTRQRIVLTKKQEKRAPKRQI